MEERLWCVKSQNLGYTDSTILWFSTYFTADSSVFTDWNLCVHHSIVSKLPYFLLYCINVRWQHRGFANSVLPMWGLLLDCHQSWSTTILQKHNLNNKAKLAYIWALLIVMVTWYRINRCMQVLLATVIISDWIYTWFMSEANRQSHRRAYISYCISMLSAWVGGLVVCSLEIQRRDILVFPYCFPFKNEVHLITYISP